MSRKNQALPPPPPPAARWLLDRMSRYVEDFAWAGDMTEEYHEHVREKGQRAATIWYWRQVLGSFPDYICNLIWWSIVMYLNFLKTALRNVRRQMVYSTINIAGLALGLACFLLIAMYIQHELSFDEHHENADRVYRIGRNLKPGHSHSGKTRATSTPPLLAPTLLTEYSGIETAARCYRTTDVLLQIRGDSFIEDQLFLADPEIFRIFTLPLVQGDPATVLSRPRSLVLSRRAAEKYFGDEDPLGKTIRVENKLDLEVTGVMSDMPRNSHFVADFITGFSSMDELFNYSLDNWSWNLCSTYLLLKNSADAPRVEGDLHRIVKPHLNEDALARMHPEQWYFLQPVTDIHLQSDLDGEWSPGNDRENIFLFASIAVLILLIAIINYMNLATARAGSRRLEVGVRKVIGASRSQLVRHFFAESFVFSIMALAGSVVLAVTLLPLFNRFMERELEPGMLLAPGFMAFIVLVVCLVGLTAGSYPAFLLSSFRPVSLMHNDGAGTRKGISVRNVLVITQFAISITLIVCTLTVSRQLDFMRDMDVGYSGDQIVVVGLGDPELQRKTGPLINELAGHPAILAVTASGSLPHSIHSQASPDWPGRDEESGNFDAYFASVDPGFLPSYGIRLTRGRNFRAEEEGAGGCEFIINESMARLLGWPDPLNRELIYWRTRSPGKIVGIMEDFNFQPLHRPIEPLYFVHDPEDGKRYLSIKIRGENIPESLAYIEERLKAVSPEYPFDYSFFDEYFDRAYREERRLGLMFDAFSVLAVVIACLGLFGLASFATERRTKEIGIRKVLGATLTDIVVMLTRELTRWILLANLLAWPAAWFSMSGWLESFAYRATLSPDVFLAAAALTFVLAVLTVLSQAARVVSVNPVRSLRYE